MMWSPSKTGKTNCVLVYFYGGGYHLAEMAADNMIWREMARRGIVSVTVNYRLGVFGLSPI